MEHTDQKELKKTIRQGLLARRDALPEAERAVMDNLLCDKIRTIITERNAQVIHSYLPFGSEPDIRPVLQWALDSGRRVICPRSLPKRVIEDLVLHSLNELEEGRFGTKHPAGGHVYTGAINLYLVPGVAFDNACHRLGYGAGYYDTYFATHIAGHKLGVCYGFQAGVNFPIEAHDVPLDGVVWG